MTFDQGCQMIYFQTKNPDLGKILEGLAMEDVGIFYNHLVNFTSILYILWLFGIFMVILHIFHRFGTLYQEKPGNTDPKKSGSPDPKSDFRLPGSTNFRRFSPLVGETNWRFYQKSM
jgi:hypothetical protein